MSVVAYLDDILCISDTEAECLVVFETLVELLQ